MSIRFETNTISLCLTLIQKFSIVSAGTILSVLKSASDGPAKLQRQASLKKLEEQDESESSDDPRPFVAEESLRLTKEKLMPLNQQVRGPLERRPDFRTPLPFVFILGNHSSGKSSFINFILQRKIQEAGVAPTDDGFSIIAPGPEDAEMDGPTLVGGDDFGFTGLRSFGSGLVEHVKMKIRNKLALQEVILIDSPGMIDSPADSVNFNTSKEKKGDRGYDFEGVVRWFAQRADVILLFFDPDKPGTTGETLSVLTNALTNVDHKLLIVLNKADMFQRSADFARSYGALCWNLAKVIPRKDLPRIYTTYTPGTQSESTMTISKEARSELDTVRNELINEIRLAPFRRMDNHITSLYDQTRVLKMHTEILQDVRDSYRNEKLKAVGFTLGGGALGVGALFAAVNRDADSVSLGMALGLGVVPAVAGLVYGVLRVRAKAQAFASGKDEPLDDLFRKRFKQEIAERDESTNNVWVRIRPQIKVAIEHFSLQNLPRIAQEQIIDLDKILTNSVPSLRRKAANRFARLNQKSQMNQKS
jgi:GTPase Era involved in 16S rRNA processing